MNILDTILEQKKIELEILKKRYTLKSFESMEFFDKINFSLISNINNSDNLSIIAELKKQSPSKGVINSEFDYKKITETYFELGVECVSILTDKKFFGGNIKILQEIASIKNTALLRKEFIIDVAQVFQSKAYGADVILLICELLSKEQINELTQAANEIGLEVLLEFHSKEQIEKIDFNSNKLIGINNRNLEDFSVNINSTVKMLEFLPKDITVISESGIGKKEEIDLLKAAKVNAVLVGEYLMSSNDVRNNLLLLKEWCNV